MPRDPYHKNTSEIGRMLPTRQAIKLCRKAGIKQQQHTAIEYLRKELFPELLETIVKDAIGLADYSENKTVQLKHVEKAVELRYNRIVY